MGRVAYVLLAAALSAGCAGHPTKAPPVVVAPPPLADAMPLGIPTEALGTYSAEGAPLVGLVDVGGRLFFIWPERAAFLKVEKSARGFTLRLPPDFPQAPDDGQIYNDESPGTPTTFELLPPTGDQGFRLEASWGTLLQLENPWAERMARNGVAELEHQDLSESEQGAEVSSASQSVVIGPGSLMRVDTKDQKGVAGCDLGILLPEPTENRGRPWAPFKPPAAGKLGAYSYVMFVLQSGPPGSCNQLHQRELAYPVRHGVYYFRLFSNAQAQIRGALFMAYMTTALLAVKGVSNGEIMELVRANSEEVSRQAE